MRQTAGRVVVLIVRILVALFLAWAAAASITALLHLKPGWQEWTAQGAIIIAVLLLQGAIFVAEGWSTRPITLVEGKAKFDRFFQKWYQEAIRLRILCKDLDWLATTSGSSILACIKDKGDRAKVYVHDNNSSKQVITELKNAGVQVVSIPVVPESRLSMREVDDDCEIIVRIKAEPRPGGQVKKIWVRRLGHQYSIGLAKQTFAALDQVETVQ